MVHAILNRPDFVVGRVPISRIELFSRELAVSTSTAVLTHAFLYFLYCAELIRSIFLV